MQLQKLNTCKIRLRTYKRAFIQESVLNRFTCRFTAGSHHSSFLLIFGNPFGKRLTAEGVLSLPFTLFLKSLAKPLAALFHGLSCKTRVFLVESSRWPIIHLLQVLPASCCSFEKLIPSCNFVAQPLNIPPFYSSISNLTYMPSFDIRPEHIGENFLFCLSPCSTEQYLHIQTSILFPKMQAPLG